MILHKQTRKSALALCLLLGAFFVEGCNHSTAAVAHDAKNQVLVGVAKKVRGQIVQVVVPLPNGMTALGSGFWIDERGYIATCWHVVSENPNDVRVQSAVDSLFDLKNNNMIFANWETFRAKVVSHDENNDVAILKVEHSPFNQKRNALIKIGEKSLTAHYEKTKLATELPESGEKVLVAGYPLGQPYSVVQEGSVASVAHSLPGWGDTLKILISAVANHGNSGGPVFNDDGEVIGLLEGELQTQPNERTGLEIVVPIYYLSELFTKTQ